MKPSCVLIKSKSFMIESEDGKKLIPEIQAVTTENGWPDEENEESQDGQPIEPSTGPQWEVEGFTVSTEDITSSDKAGTMYEEILDMINGHIEENYLYLTSE